MHTRTTYTHYCHAEPISWNSFPGGVLADSQRILFLTPLMKAFQFGWLHPPPQKSHLNPMDLEVIHSIHYTWLALSSRWCMSFLRQGDAQKVCLSFVPKFKALGGNEMRFIGNLNLKRKSKVNCIFWDALTFRNLLIKNFLRKFLQDWSVSNCLAWPSCSFLRVMFGSVKKFSGLLSYVRFQEFSLTGSRLLKILRKGVEGPSVSKSFITVGWEQFSHQFHALLHARSLDLCWFHFSFHWSIF